MAKPKERRVRVNSNVVLDDGAVEALVGEAFPEPSEDDGPFDAISTGDPVPAAVE